jgi:hypothetical protein
MAAEPTRPTEVLLRGVGGLRGQFERIVETFADGFLR